MIGESIFQNGGGMHDYSGQPGSFRRVTGGTMQRLYLEVSGDPVHGDYVKSMLADGSDEAWFANFGDLESYASSRGESLVRLQSDDEFWYVTTGQQPVPGGGVSDVLAAVPWPVLAIGGYFLYKRLAGSRSRSSRRRRR